MDSLPTAVGLAAVVWWAMGLAKAVPAVGTAPEWARRALAAAVGVAVVLVYAQAGSWADAVTVGGTPLGSLSVVQQALYGVAVGSTAGVLHDVTRATRRK